MSLTRQITWGGGSAAQFADFHADMIVGKSVAIFGQSSDSGTGGTPTSSEATYLQIWHISSSFKHPIIFWNLDNFRAAIGQRAQIIQALLYFYPITGSSSDTRTWEACEILGTHTPEDRTGPYREHSTTTWWTDSLYYPKPTVDTKQFWTDSVTLNHVTSPAADMAVDLTTHLQTQLTNMENVDFLLRPAITRGAWTSTDCNIYWDTAGYRPYVEVKYLLETEFFGVTAGGDIDLQNPLISSLDPADSLNLGIHEPGDTGAAVKAYLKNLSGQTLGLPEIFDDYPEAPIPTADSGNTGTGSLDYIQHLESAVSQTWTVTFYSATQYEVTGAAYSNNTSAIHPAIDSDPTWRKDTSTDFTSPEGGLVIPAAAWQGAGILAGDIFSVSVQGQTTLPEWPSDANDQVEITHDNAGSADASGWRPICGRRTRLAEAVTIDATTKKFAVRAGLVPGDWPTGDPAFIGDGTTLQEGTINDAQVASIGTPAFTGSGINDLALSGNYNGVWENTLRVEIDGTATFKWSKDGGSSWVATTVAMTGSAQLLSDGIYVTFPTATGYTTADYWDATIEPFALELAGLTNNSDTFAVGDRVGTTLPVDGLAASVWSNTDAASGVSETPDDRIYLPDPTAAGYTAGSTIGIMNKTTGDSEILIIDTGGVTTTYIDLTTSMVNDYPSGSLVIQAGTGDHPFWLRPVVELTSSLQLKPFRLNTRA